MVLFLFAEYIFVLSGSRIHQTTCRCSPTLRPITSSASCRRCRPRRTRYLKSWLWSRLERPVPNNSKLSSFNNVPHFYQCGSHIVITKWKFWPPDCCCWCVAAVLRFLRCVWREKSLVSLSLTVCPEERKPPGTLFPGRCRNRCCPTVQTLSINPVNQHKRDFFFANVSPPNYDPTVPRLWFCQPVRRPSGENRGQPRLPRGKAS